MACGRATAKPPQAFVTKLNKGYCASGLPTTWSASRYPGIERTSEGEERLLTTWFQVVAEQLNDRRNKPAVHAVEVNKYIKLAVKQVELEMP